MLKAGILLQMVADFLEARYVLYRVCIPLFDLIAGEQGQVLWNRLVKFGRDLVFDRLF